MKFIKSQSDRRPILGKTSTFPCVVYLKNSWNDFGVETLHSLHFFAKDNTRPIELGAVKILQLGKSVTKLPKTFTDLPEEQFVSLGQDLDYYARFRECFPDTCEDLLGALNDIVVKPLLFEKVETTAAFRNSLVRFNDAKISLRDGSAILRGGRKRKNFSFTYTGKLENAEGGISAKMDFDRKDPRPGRIVAIIGRNGAGKTQFLARLARDLSPTRRRTSALTEAGVTSAFTPRRPLFSRVIAMSFSAFDVFQTPKREPYFSYIYCGVRDEAGRLSQVAHEARHIEFLERVRDHGRSELWETCVATVLELPEEEVLLKNVLSALKSEYPPPMSSGQSILVYFISAALAYLKEDSLILFDEPEIHLHPNAVASLIQLLQDLLKRFDSYALVATHSPVVIQEVPSKRVIRFERDGNVTSAFELEQESFGENISELTRQVFETVETPNFYKEILRKLARRRTFAEVMSLFDDRLSLHASAYLASLYEGDDA